MTSVNTNNGAMAALQALRTVNGNLQNTQQQVSTGLRVEKASDNAAYWSIAATMRSDKKAMLAVSDASVSPRGFSIRPMTGWIRSEKSW
ncbi:hypothetical protein CPT34_29540 [Rhizobium sophoriradicis]|uniref:Flagellin N-terminal domain-containing protein n=1 Tax=Rhizobium sophoriradicis TaxID=1535245 RepID=A0A2A5KKS1_9HYPH|nr:hypothetical protein CPT34_29540 [Rhizobium sophoriradicis]